MLMPTGAERNFAVLRDQPAAIPQPSAEPVWPSERTYEKTLGREASEKTKLWRSASRESSARRNLFSRISSPSVRRLQISGPTDFRHLHSESFQFPPPPQESRPRPSSFRPIELSIYRQENRLSAILPHIECNITPPPRAYTGNSSNWEDGSGSSATLTQEATSAHERSHSAMSFHLPRKHSRQMSEASMSPPRIPPKSRARAATAPNTERIVERIASAMIEKERLQAEINSLVQRQSLYLNSRPSTGYDVRGLEPMPSIPALPAAGPSFAERLSTDDRPRTAPSYAHSMAPHEKTPELTASAQSSPPRRHDRVTTHNRYGSPSTSSDGRVITADFPLAPPLPLVLRPPLRKKKSFSRVSNWLFNPDAAASPAVAAAGHATTSPRPVKESDGFYQCVAPPEGLPRTSMDTSSSVYTWETGGNSDGDSNGDGGGAKTLPTATTATTWSPDQTPKQGWSSSTRHTTPVLGGSERAGLGFDKETGVPSGAGAGVAVDGEEGDGLGVDDGTNANGHRPLSVGVAF
ncbi:uncharacterized protein P884DRAFT_278099 [Thermothelomyces heterothallicus CBS 202.75]|uniref:uncharacterized protein n=1 Tax=Thermothelomyces heterothallicus CBS 202.75 TaxID=1149848 RepID=UPI003744424D